MCKQCQTQNKLRSLKTYCCVDPADYAGDRSLDKGGVLDYEGCPVGKLDSTRTRTRRGKVSVPGQLTAYVLVPLFHLFSCKDNEQKCLETVNNKCVALDYK